MFLAAEDRANMPIWLKMVPHIFRNFTIIFAKTYDHIKRLSLYDFEYLNSEKDKQRLSSILAIKNS